MSKLTFDIMPGDMDVTPDRGPYCVAKAVTFDGASFVCTREVGHTGVHAAGTGIFVAAVWEGDHEPWVAADDAPSTPHVPARYLASWAYPGCLPEMEPVHFSSAREAWDYVRLCMPDELLYAPVSDESPLTLSEYPTDLHRALSRLLEADEQGFVDGPDGYRYSVEDTYVMTCEECGRQYPDLYPAGRCPYERVHPDVQRMLSLMTALTNLGAEDLARHLFAQFYDKREKKLREKGN